jgi:hypothetical protein
VAAIRSLPACEAIAGDHFPVSRYPENQLYRANDRRERYRETFFD